MVTVMDVVETQVWREPWDVDRRLNELGLHRHPLMNVVVAAITAGADSTPFHPANASGTFSYMYGTWALRSEFVGDEWELDRADGVESIRNDQKKVKVVYQNVDIACDNEQGPKPRSHKGAGSERACSGNLFGTLLPQYSPCPTEEWATYYLMVDKNGAVELTRPVVRGGTFSAYVERIYLSDGGDLLDLASLPIDDDDTADGFDPQVVRK